MNINLLNKYLEKFNYEKVTSKHNNCSPTFIVGAPRSGSTFLYQLIISIFDFAYPSNFIAKFWGNPLAGYILQDELLGNERKEFISSFKSYHGFTENSFLEPHEFGYFWSRWFDHSENHFSSENEKVDFNLIEILNDLEVVSNKNWVFKNLTLGLKIPLLKKIFPNAKFIYIKRDLYDNALSLYKGRIERFNNDKTWWSLEPKEIKELKKLLPKEQVIAQVYYINKQIEEDLLTINKSDYITIEYKNLLNCVDTEINKLEVFFDKDKMRKILNVPTFTKKTEIKDKELEYYKNKYSCKENK